MCDGFEKINGQVFMIPSLVRLESTNGLLYSIWLEEVTICGFRDRSDGSDGRLGDCVQGCGIVNPGVNGDRSNSGCQTLKDSPEMRGGRTIEGR